MKNKLSILLIMIFVLTLSACSQKEEGVKKDSVGNYVPEMIDLSEKAKNEVQEITEKENEKINNLINENNMEEQKNPNIPTDLANKYSTALIKTNMGDIKVEFYSEAAPLTVNNFLNLAQKEFYNGVKFHRVIKGFMIQAGDPFSKDDAKKDLWGTGGPGYKFEDELTGKEKYLQGTLAMANSGPNTNGSQFFIVTAGPSVSLPPAYTVFGKVVEGMDTALKIENVKTLRPGQLDRPEEDVTIEKIDVLVN
jgi:cyclophilin family peptidyl-prolyl cis-trans isomerase